MDLRASTRDSAVEAEWRMRPGDFTARLDGGAGDEDRGDAAVAARLTDGKVRGDYGRSALRASRKRVEDDSECAERGDPIDLDAEAYESATERRDHGGSWLDTRAGDWEITDTVLNCCWITADGSAANARRIARGVRRGGDAADEALARAAHAGDFLSGRVTTIS